VLRPQEISNNPAIVRQLGIISMNTALEVDVFGHVNSTHLFGQRMMNGIGGSGDLCPQCIPFNFHVPVYCQEWAISTICANVYARRS